MSCLCALTFMVSLGFTNVGIKDVYGLPLHCVQGKFHYDREQDALVFRRQVAGAEEIVSIRLPPLNIHGTFQATYCWGRLTARVGNQEVGVVIQIIKKGLA